MGTVLADDGTTYSFLTHWEAIVGTPGGHGGTCTLTGSFDEAGIILDYTNNALDDPSATFVYKITGGKFYPTAVSPFGVINIVTSTIIKDLEISGITGREGGNFIEKGIDITLIGDETAHLYRVQVSGLGELGGNDKVGIKCDDQSNTDRTVQLNHCYVTDVRASGGKSAYGISFAHTSRGDINITNRPTISANNCTVDSITSQNDSSADHNESFGFKVTNVSGTQVNACVSHKISGGNGYFGGSSSVLCYGGDDGGNNMWGAGQGSLRAFVNSCQSSDRTGLFTGVHDKDINDFSGAPGRPDPSVEWKSENEIHPLKIARSSAAGDVTINGVYSPDNIGAFGTYRVINVGSDQTDDDTYSTLTSAILGAQTNPVYGVIGPPDAVVGIPYLLGTENYPHSGPTWAVFNLSGGEFTEQIKSGMLTSRGHGPLVTWAGNVFTGLGPYSRAVFRPGHEGYGDSLLDFVGNSFEKPTELVVQHIEVHMENNRWSHGIIASGTFGGSLVHDCIVSGSGYLSGSTITESVEVGIAADVVTTSLVYGKINYGIRAVSKGYNNTVVLDNMSLTGTGIICGSVTNNLVLTSGTNFSNSSIDSGGGGGNISDSRTQVNNYFTDAANDDYTLKINSHALDSGVVPTYLSDYVGFLPVWPYGLMYSSGVTGHQAMDYSHWFIDGGGGGSGPVSYVGEYTRNRFSIDVAVSGFDTGWDERHGQRTDPQPPFIAFMDF
jgi:hypothetical protein